MVNLAVPRRGIKPAPDWMEMPDHLGAEIKRRINRLTIVGRTLVVVLILIYCLRPAIIAYLLWKAGVSTGVSIGMSIYGSLLPGFAVTLLVLGVAAFSLLWPHQFIRKRAKAAAVFTDHARCASCANDLSQQPRDQDGLVQCPFCRAAWDIRSAQIHVTTDAR